MPKARSVFICQNCSFQSSKWMGQCTECKSWNTFVESIPQTTSPTGKKAAIGATNTFYLSTVSTKATKRTSSNIGEFDRVLGGGFVKGQVILLAGDPGVGKSTLLTQLAKSMTEQKSAKPKNVLYVCGEESSQQIRLRANRMNYKGENLVMLPEINVEKVVATIESQVVNGEVGLVIVDSIQTQYSEELTGIAGSVGQVRLCSQKLSAIAKSLSVPLILVGHVTKEGTVAGPKVLEHLVDTVLYLEGDSQHLFRILKTTKNRFGPVSEVGIFEMQDTGLSEVVNPSEIFLKEASNVSGSCTTVVMEGHRPLLFEIQALTTKTAFGYPVRTTSGFNANRLKVLIAILEKRAGVNLSDLDVYVNVAGGFKISEYACDLAVCLAIVSSARDKPIKAGVAAFGECGLLGEIRRVSNDSKRIKEAKKLGYNKVIGPEKVKDVRMAIKLAF